uniref:Translation elongation factor EF1B beta/delta subunit guanine nucleotide exchange domain-containing protein n=1 Tax=Arion vulgaris TaxID=1028688 RepID=A0A0B6YSE3_9EUPU
MANALLLENVWLNQHKFEDAERAYRQAHVGTTNTEHHSHCSGQKTSCSLAGEIAQVRQDIKNVLDKPVAAVVGDGGDASVYKRLEHLEKESKELKKIVEELRALVLGGQVPVKEAPPVSNSAPSKPQPQPVPQKPAADDDDDDDCDLFGSDDEEAKALKEKRLKEYAEKKAKKPVLIAKSSVVLDVKPWDDETDMVEMEKRVRSIQQDGLVWGASKLVAVGYGIQKLTIICVVEDDKVSIEDLNEKIAEENEDLVQSVDVAAFNKI